MWKNTEGLDDDVVNHNKDNLNFNINNDLHQHKSLSTSIINQHQDSNLYNDNLIKTNNNEIGTQAVAIQSGI
jgi:hypothetical protein